MPLPLTNNPEENFRVSIDSIVYNFKQLWNPVGFWTLSIYDSDNIIMVYGVKIVTLSLLLEQYPHVLFDLYSENESDPIRDNLDEFILEVITKDV